MLDSTTVAEATVDARERARADGDATWLAYAVYGHPNARLYSSQLPETAATKEKTMDDAAQPRDAFRPDVIETVTDGDLR